MDDSAITAGDENVIQRLRRRIREVRAMGFQVRQELLGGQPPAWCEIAGRKWLFLDAAQPARDQLRALEEVLADYRGDPEHRCEPVRT